MSEYKIAPPPPSSRPPSDRRLRGTSATGSSASVTSTGSAASTGSAPMHRNPPMMFTPERHVRFPSDQQLTEIIPRSPESVEGEEDTRDFTLYQTLYPYKSDDEDDLTFEANEILRVFDDAGGDHQSWFYGCTQDGREGSFPGTYVRKIRMVSKKFTINADGEVQDEPEGASDAMPPPPSGPPPSAPSSASSAPAASSSSSSSGSKEPEPHECVLYQALYDYNSGDPDDLAFKANDIIRVTDEGDGPESWFYGWDQHGHEGNFPGTFVRKIPMQARTINITGLEDT